MEMIIRLIFTFFTISHLHAAVSNVYSDEILVDPDGKPRDLFGHSIAMNRMYVIVSSKFGKNHTGSVSIFRNRRKAKYVKNLKISTRDKNPWFGSSLAINERYLVVGSRGIDSVYIYNTNSRTWRYNDIIKADRNANWKHGISFGAVVDINSNNEIVVGAPNYVNGAGDVTGAAYVYYTRYGRNWRRRQVIAPEDSVGLGYAVALTSKYMALSVHQDSTAQNHRFVGAVYLYERTSNNEWTNKTKLRSPTPVKYGLFGFSLSMYGNRLVIGAPNEDMTKGKAYVYTRDENGWKLESELRVNDYNNRTPYNYFGHSVSIYGGKIVVGSYRHEAHVFERSGRQWVEKSKLIPSRGKEKARLFSVRIFNNTVVVGCSSNTKGEKSGTAHSFTV